MRVKSNNNFQENADIDTVWYVLIDHEQEVVCVPEVQLTYRGS